MQWHGDTAEHPVQCLRFFAERGHRQFLAACYDASPRQVRAWLDSAQDVPNVVGVMGTTWMKRYDDLEAVSALLQGAGW